MPKFVLPLCVLLAAASPALGATCESLASLSLPNTIITAAQAVAAGAFTPPATGRGGSGSNPYGALPPFCRVAATLKPVPQSDIRMEIWMPANGWNGKLQVVGNGGFAGSISFPAMATALAAGYATASTDTGHVGGAAAALTTEAALTDFAHRAIHETTVASKKLADAFYGGAPKLAYFNGCSTGGRQALTAAQRYPEDFDGIIAGDAAAYGIRQSAGQIWIYQATAKDPASTLTREQYTLLQNAVLTACDAKDGVTDGVLENPRACTFDPKTVAGLTPAQAEAARKIYQGAVNTRTGTRVFHGLEVGSELNWSAQPVGYAVDLFRYIVYKDPEWDPKSLNFDSDLAALDKKENQVLDYGDADLRPFFRGGGKLLMYHGWSDAGIPPGSSIEYYEDVRKKTGNAARESIRLFMVPGMGHCGGGQGTSTFNMAAALDAWVTTGRAPASIPASRVRDGIVDRTRPLCPYPQQAIYKGSGSTDDAANFTCGVPTAPRPAVQPSRPPAGSTISKTAP